jgi:hypothetical protein
VDGEKSSLPPEEGQHTVQKWHGTKNTVMKDRQSNRDDRRIRQGIKLQEEPE